jgi:hypothetical protein
MTDNKTITANFRRYSESEAIQMVPGESINKKIRELSALPGGSSLAPAPGLYESGTVQIQGKVTFKLKEKHTL